MKKFKDFIYDKNDIIIAILIMAAAALIIFWRLNVILDYPKQFLASEEPSVETPAENPDNDGTPAAENDKPESGTQTEGNDAETDQQDASLWQGGVLTKDVEVDVTGNSASAAIQCLIDKGLFEDYAEYQQICEENGLDHEKVKAGTFTFKQGSTKKDIAKEMNWG